MEAADQTPDGLKLKISREKRQKDFLFPREQIKKKEKRGIIKKSKVPSDFQYLFLLYREHIAFPIRYIQSNMKKIDQHG